MNNKSGILREFLLAHLDDFLYSGSGGHGVDIPTYDLYASDYLSFAEQELNSFRTVTNEKEKASKMIRYISHLKQAMDNQLSVFLEVYNLENYFSSKKLGFDKKLDFLEKVGIFSPHSLRRLNAMRNRMEHKFEVPVLEEAGIYYDLVFGFVAVLQSVTLAKYTSSHIEVQICKPFNGERILDLDTNGDFLISYARDKPQILVNTKVSNIREEMSCSIDEYDDFVFFVKVLFLLQYSRIYPSTEYLRLKLLDNQ